MPSNVSWKTTTCMQIQVEVCSGRSMLYRGPMTVLAIRKSPLSYKKKSQCYNVFTDYYCKYYDARSVVRCNQTHNRHAGMTLYLINVRFSTLRHTKSAMECHTALTCDARMRGNTVHQPSDHVPFHYVCREHWELVNCHSEKK